MTRILNTAQSSIGQKKSLFLSEITNELVCIIVCMLRLRLIIWIKKKVDIVYIYIKMYLCICKYSCQNNLVV